MSDRDLETALAESMRDAGISPYHRGTKAEGLASGAIIAALAARGWRLVPSAGDGFREAYESALSWAEKQELWVAEKLPGVHAAISSNIVEHFRRFLAAQPSAEPGLGVADPDNPFWIGLRDLIVACRRKGTCLLCGVPASTMHEPDCAVEAAVRVLEPGYAKVAAALTPDPPNPDRLTEARDEAAYWRRQAIGAESPT